MRKGKNDIDKDFSKRLRAAAPQIKKALKNLYGNVMPDVDKYYQQLFSDIKADERINLFSSITGRKIQSKKKVLEIGSGFGYTVYKLSLSGIKAYGIEPDTEILELTKKLYKNQIKKGNLTLVEGYGENLAFPDKTFDVVMSFQVLEHVQNPDQVIKESYRVLKRGGYLYHVIPNYNSFWEGHYGIPWIPNILSKPELTKLYLRIFFPRKNVAFLKEIRNITPFYIKSALAKLPGSEIITLGEDIFRKRLASDYAPRWGKTGRLFNLKKMLNVLHLDKIIGGIFVKMGFYYPIIVIVRKNK